MDRLPFRLEADVAPLLGTSAPPLTVLASDPGMMPRLSGAFTTPASANVSVVLRVHSATGIPLAFAEVQVARGDRTFETSSVTFLGLEGYTHLKAQDLRSVQDRMWSRRAFATARRALSGSAAPAGGGRS